MIEERITHDQMKALCPDLTAKTELVLVCNPVTDDEAMYQRDGKDWVRLDDGLPRTDGAALESPSPGAAPLSGEVGPDRGLHRGDDDPAEPSGPLRSLPGGPAESNP